MLPDLQKIIDVFECMSLDNTAYFTFINQDNIKVCVQYEKKNSKKNWTIWFAEHESNSKQTISSQNLFSVIDAFKINENNFKSEVANILLFQAAFADEFIRQVTLLLGNEAIQKSILNTQIFMNELSESINQVFKKEIPSSNKPNGDRKGLRVIK